MKINRLAFYFLIILQINSSLIFNLDLINDGTNLELLKKKQGDEDRGEDSLATSKIAFIVADGVGGNYFTAKHLSSFVTTSYMDYILKKSQSEIKTFTSTSEIRVKLLEMAKASMNSYVESTKKNLLDLKSENIKDGYQKKSQIMTSTTFVSAYLESGEESAKLRIGQSGDSLAIVFRKTKLPNSTDQFYYKPIFMTKEMQFSYNFPIQLSADIEIKASDIFSTEIEVLKDDIVILGSDGLFDNVHIGFLTKMLNYIVTNSSKVQKNVLLENLLLLVKIYIEKTSEKSTEETKRTKMMQLLELETIRKIPEEIENERKQYLSKINAKVNELRTQRTNRLNELHENRNKSKKLQKFLKIFQICGYVKEYDDLPDDAETIEIRRLKNLVYEPSEKYRVLSSKVGYEENRQTETLFSTVSYYSLEDEESIFENAQKLGVRLSEQYKELKLKIKNERVLKTSKLKEKKENEKAQLIKKTQPISSGQTNESFEQFLKNKSESGIVKDNEGNNGVSLKEESRIIKSPATEKVDSFEKDKNANKNNEHLSNERIPNKFQPMIDEYLNSDFNEKDEINAPFLEDLTFCRTIDIFSQPKKFEIRDDYLGECLEQIIAKFMSFSEKDLQSFQNKISALDLSNMIAKAAKEFSSSRNYISPFYIHCFNDSEALICSKNGKPDDISVVAATIIEGEVTTHDFQYYKENLEKEHQKTLDFLKKDIKAFISIAPLEIIRLII